LGGFRFGKMAVCGKKNILFRYERGGSSMIWAALPIRIWYIRTAFERFHDVFYLSFLFWRMSAQWELRREIKPGMERSKVIFVYYVRVGTAAQIHTTPAESGYGIALGETGSETEFCIGFRMVNGLMA
jgi:hypothetical protein